MQIQKHLFRIAERALKNQQGLIYWKAVFYFLTITSIFFTLLFGYGYLVILPSNLELTKCSQKASFKFQQDTVNILTDISLSAEQIQYYNSNNQIIYDNKSCMIIKNRNTTALDQFKMEVGGQRQVIFMDQPKRAQLNYSNYTFVLKQYSLLRKLLFNYQNLLINEILENKYQIFPKLPYVKSATIIIYHHDRDIELSILNKILLLFYAIFSYFIISVVTSLYIYGTIIAAPAVILIFLKCCHYLRNQSTNEVYRIFPWIGLHSIVRETSQNPKIKQSSMQIYKAILFYFLFLYLVYYASIIWVDKSLFYFHTETGIQQLLFGYIALVEFAAIVFMRTRTFIKYFPSFHCILVIIMLYYGEISVFGFKKLACYTVFSISCALFIWMIIHVEIPAQTTWDHNDHFTPTLDRPRIGYFPIFNMTWISNLPEQWTMMIPLFGRQNFLPRQMALVDRNFQQLGQALQN